MEHEETIIKAILTGYRGAADIADDMAISARAMTGPEALRTLAKILRKAK